jgi:hypothetical protein
VLLRHQAPTKTRKDFSVRQTILNGDGTSLLSGRPDQIDSLMWLIELSGAIGVLVGILLALT